MRERLRRRFYVESGLAIVSLVLLVVTLISKEWIEIVFGVDPDGGSGALEWAIVVMMVAVTALSAVLARLEWRRGLATA